MIFEKGLEGSIKFLNKVMNGEDPRVATWDRANGFKPSYVPKRPCTAFVRLVASAGCPVMTPPSTWTMAAKGNVGGQAADGAPRNNSLDDSQVDTLLEGHRDGDDSLAD
eukprot:1127072-Amphidinium_carterae.1